MKHLQDGSRVALGELYDRLAPRAYRTAMSVCHDRSCAEDAVQDAFVSIWSSRGTYRAERGAVERWALSIVRHRAIYLARRRVREGSSEETRLEQQPASDDVPRDYACRADTEQLVRLIARLPPAQQQVIQLGFFGGLTHEEIARRLDLPRGTVKGRMRLGLRKLRGGLDPCRTPDAGCGPNRPTRGSRNQP
jgi:RNA polymerase sigma-70 factor (ECF subfamily)